MKIPIYINSFNRLTYLRNMVNTVRNWDDAGEIIIVDNQSTLPGLAEYLNEAEADGITVKRLLENGGPRAPWRCVDRNADHYVITDPDLDLSGIPPDVLVRLRRGLLDYPKAVKAALGIRYEDIPLEYPFRRQAVDQESANHVNKWDNFWWKGAIDTQFALYRQGQAFDYAPCLIAPPPYELRHCCWYDWDTEQEREYLRLLPQKHKAGLVYSTLAQDALRK